MRRHLRRIYRWIHPEPIPLCDSETLSVLEKVLRPDSNTVDIGCNRGSVLREMVRLSPAGRHFAFEPIPRLSKLLRRRFPNVECHGVALSDRRGVVRFHHFVENYGLSGLVRRRESGVVREIEIHTERLDDILPAKVRIDLIKIDVEGAEYSVLRGAEATVRTCKPTIIFECGKGALDIYGHTPMEVFAFFEDCKFSIRPLERWFPLREPLGLRSFAEEFEAGRNFMFVASPTAPGTA